jgi:RNase H-fold protein (predicted Holliday junction resolvase)
MAFPRDALEVSANLFADIARFVADEEIELVLVGRPLSLAGSETESTRLADAFREQVSDSVAPIEVMAWDERLTTSTAHARYGRKPELLRSSDVLGSTRRRRWRRRRVSWILSRVTVGCWPFSVASALFC